MSQGTNITQSQHMHFCNFYMSDIQFVGIAEKRYRNEVQRALIPDSEYYE